MSSTRAAIVIPAYNAATTIGDTLDALQVNEGLSRIALVALLDDCSKDETVEVARAHWKSPAPFEIWRNPENMGERRTTNAAMFRLTDRVEWTFILHADDVVKPYWLSLYLDELPRIPASVASICSSYDNWWPVSGKIVAGDERPELSPVHAVGDRARVLDALERGCWWHLSGCAIRNKAFLQIGGFEPDMPQLGDWEWLLRCLGNGHDIWYLRRTTMLYRQHERSVSSVSFREGRDLRERLRILTMMRARGYLDRDKHRAKLRSLIYHAARRTLVRSVRRDRHGLQKHAAFLSETTLRYMLGRP